MNALNAIHRWCRNKHQCGDIPCGQCYNENCPLAVAALEPFWSAPAAAPGNGKPGSVLAAVEAAKRHAAEQVIMDHLEEIGLEPAISKATPPITYTCTLCGLSETLKAGQPTGYLSIFLFDSNSMERDKSVTFCPSCLRHVKQEIQGPFGGGVGE